MAAKAGPLEQKMPPFTLSDLPPPEQKHHLDPSPKTRISTLPLNSLLPSNLRNKQPNQRCSAEAVTGPCMSVAGVGVLVLRPTRDGTDLSVSSAGLLSSPCSPPFSELHPPRLPQRRRQEGRRGQSPTLHYNHIYGLSVSVTVYGPWDRPDMTFFSFTKSILSRKPITRFRMPHGTAVQRHVSYIDDVFVEGCLCALNTAKKLGTAGTAENIKPGQRLARAGGDDGGHP
ncbi:hypothetical protein BHE74_00015582 [Ensete ventricosum]|nr:hypothetical protein BHE74_00015582 [Ensete ventricosum]